MTTQRQPRVRDFKLAHTVGFGAALILLGTLWVPIAAAQPSCKGERATIVGTQGADLIAGTRGADVIVSRGGNDTIRSRGGSDVICSGGGLDRVNAGSGSDRIEAGGGNDPVNGGKGRDRANGGTGIDGCRKSETLRNCEADLDVDVQGPATMSDNDVVDWTFDFSNQGPSPAPGTSLAITLAPRLTVDTLTSGCSEAPVDTVTCRLGKLDIEESGEVVITAHGPSTCDFPQTDSFEVSAVIDASRTRDHAPGDNTDSQTTPYTDFGC